MPFDSAVGSPHPILRAWPCSSTAEVHVSEPRSPFFSGASDPFATAGIELRRAETEDDDLIRRILSLAVGWRSPGPLADRASGHDAYHEGWMRNDDVGVLAFSGIEFVGGAYARRVGPADGTYGYLDPDLWELTIGVEHDHRRQGLGRLVLETLKARTLERGIAGLSLSVEIDNPAVRLYESAGFVVVERRQTDLVMSWSLGKQ